MMSNTVEAVQTDMVWVGVAYAVMISFGGIFATGWVGGFGVEIVREKYTSYLSMDSITNAIWGVVYAWQFVAIAVQCSVTRGSVVEQLMRQTDMIFGLTVRWRLIIVFGLNAIWLPCYTSFNFVVAAVVIVPYLGMLISVYSDLTLRKCSWSVWLLVGAPISVHVSWVVVTVSTSLFTLCGDYGWKDFDGVAGTAEAAVVVIFGLGGLSVFMAFATFDPVWPSVTAWAVGGIMRSHFVAGGWYAALVAVEVCTGVSAFFAVGCMCYYQGSSPPKPQPIVYDNRPYLMAQP